jgi:enamine deaminase RidA (YjgF/YER057c/UK114 family)
MERRRVQSGSPYEDRYGFARALRVGDRVDVAGTAPIPPAGEPVAPSGYDQMLRCGEIARLALEELDASIQDVVRTRMFIVDPADADDIGRAHNEVFGAARPVATMVVVAALLDPAWRVEIEVEAVVAD